MRNQYGAKSTEFIFDIALPSSAEISADGGHWARSSEASWRRASRQDPRATRHRTCSSCRGRHVALRPTSHTRSSTSSRRRLACIASSGGNRCACKHVAQRRGALSRDFLALRRGRSADFKLTPGEGSSRSPRPSSRRLRPLRAREAFAALRAYASLRPRGGLRSTHVSGRRRAAASPGG